jgi:hypothetical protein
MPPSFPFQLITSAGHNPTTDSPVCLDVELLGGAEAAQNWIRARGLDTRDRSKMKIIAALGCSGGDLSELARLVDGITQRPEVGNEEGWERALRPILHALHDPNYRDELPPEVTQGAVSQEAFVETLAQAALPSSDPNKRD